MTFNELSNVSNQNYYTADMLWKKFGAPTREEYAQKYIIPGRFHSLVPEEIELT